MRQSVENMSRQEVIDRYGCSRVTAWRAMKRGWICVQKENTVPMSEADGHWVLSFVAWIRDDDLQSNAILRLVELWGDVIAARNKKQFAARICRNEILRKRRIAPPPK